MATIVKEEKLASIKQFDCTGCGSALEVFNPRAKYISCQYCGNVLDTQSEEHQIMMSLSPPEQHRPLSFIKIGLVANFFGKKYQVIARTRWLQDYQEYYNEDGESGYSKELWAYDEWLMISEQRTYFYLVEDKSGYYISDEIIPTKPSLPSNGSNYWSFLASQSEQLIQEYGSAQVLHFEGESNYQIKINDTIGFASYKQGKDIYTGEWRLDEETGDIKEIEFFRETYISKKEVLAAFEANEELDAFRDKGKFWQWMYYGAAASTVAFFVLLLSSLGGGNQEVFSQTFDFSTLDDSIMVISNPINIEKEGLHCLSMDANIGLENQEIFAVTYFLDKDKAAVNSLDGDFAIYTGYEDGEYYSEATTSSEKLVNVEESGTYYAQIIADKEDGLPGDLTISVRTGYLLSRYFFWSFILMGILTFVFRSRMKIYL